MLLKTPKYAERCVNISERQQSRQPRVIHRPIAWGSFVAFLCSKVPGVCAAAVYRCSSVGGERLAAVLRRFGTEHYQQLHGRHDV